MFNILSIVQYSPGNDLHQFFFKQKNLAVLISVCFTDSCGVGIINVFVLILTEQSRKIFFLSKLEICMLKSFRILFLGHFVQAL